MTYGGAAGAWFGLVSQVGDVMSMPEYNLFFDVRPVTGPIDEASGQTTAPAFNVNNKSDHGSGTVITSKCENIPKLLSALDFMYSDEGAMMRTYGLTKEQGAAENEYYQAAGLEEGVYWFEGNDFVFNPLTTAAGGTIDVEPMMGNKLPAKTIAKYTQIYSKDLEVEASEKWTKYADDTKKSLPNSLTPDIEDEIKLADNNVRLQDYINAEIPKFIMGTTELNDTNWQSFQDQLKAYGASDNIEVLQAAYERFLER